MMLMKGLVGGIAYDITTSALGSNGRSSGTFEAMVKYCFKKAIILISIIYSSFF